jgi:large subunit ribosomal protein L23
MSATNYEVLRRPVITEKGLVLKEEARTLCFEVAARASKQQIRETVERIFKVKVDHVRTMKVPGKLRRRGKYAGYRPDWKKAYVTLREGEKMFEYGEVV